MGLDTLQSGITTAIGAVKTNPIATAVGVGGTVLAGGIVAAAVVRSKRKKSSKRKNSRKKSSSRRSRRARRRRTPYTAGKAKDRSRKRIRYTKRGQPYVIMASGKARFISLRSAKISRKRKGGRY